ncbi:smad nuclear interacting protein [Echinococcus multilocularis]|uniref:Smad nuclear interacting protein n=1 Tax=Echinococcus multilocularis TaxID=6211 RepID=A0A068XWM3_ECHMU|nr:smad nuclear interacting protein [Echinococcus multilocularis]
MEDSSDVTTTSDDGPDSASTETEEPTKQEEQTFKTPETVPAKRSSEEISSENLANSCAYYQPPDWACTCPSASRYFLEVIKNGISLPEATIDLSDIDHRILGRQPGPLLNPQNPTGRTATLLHPSISRAHAVLQFGSNSDLSPGWYVYDLDSTHGTFVNKHRVPSGRYIRLRVGYVLRFGSSTRLLILNGPESDVESETKETWSELVAKKKAKREGEKRKREEESDANICNWGMEDDGDEDENVLQQRLAESGNCLSHESSYIADPKRALRAFFDREGLDPLPEYEFVEGRFGQQMCRIELPLDAGTLFAEVPMTGQKRKEAIAACALEACRILDHLGEFDANREGVEAVRRAREKAYWQSNDYYSSDEDTFLDRTGQIEARRRRRMRRMGVEGAEVTSTDDSMSQETSEEPQDSLSVLATLEELGRKIIEVEMELDAAEQAMQAAGENATEMDELEAYMEAIKRGAPKRAERQALKRRLVALRQEETRLLRKVGIRGGGSSAARFSSSASSAAATAVRAVASQQSGTDGRTNEASHTESRLNSIKRQLPEFNRRSHQIGEKRALQKKEIEKETEGEEVFVPEVEEDDDSQIGVDTKPESPKPKVARNEEAYSPTVSTDKVHSAASSPSKQLQEPLRVVEEDKVVHRPRIGPQQLSHSVDDKVVKDEQSPAVSVELSSELSPPTEIGLDDAYDYSMNDPNFALWMPPKDQTGDGMTELNKKYGY